MSGGETQPAGAPRRVWIPAVLAGVVCAAALLAQAAGVLSSQQAGGVAVAAGFWALDVGSARFHMADPAVIRRAVQAYWSPALTNTRQALGALISLAGGLAVALSPARELTFFALLGWGVLCAALIIWQGGVAERLARSGDG